MGVIYEMENRTSLQEIVDAVKIKIPTEDLTGKENHLAQLLKSATARCKRKTYDKIDFYYDKELQEGYFYNSISEPTIELLSMYIVKDYTAWQFSILNNRKQYLGTNAFNKIPSYKDRYDFLMNQLEYWNNEIAKFEMEFPDYSEER